MTAARTRKKAKKRKVARKKIARKKVAPRHLSSSPRARKPRKRQFPIISDVDNVSEEDALGEIHRQTAAVPNELELLCHELVDMTYNAEQNIGSFVEDEIQKLRDAFESKLEAARSRLDEMTEEIDDRRDELEERRENPQD